MDEKSLPVELLLESVASALTARRGVALEKVRRVEEALEGYRRAVDAQVVREFAREHGFKQPAPAAMNPERAAELVRVAVNALPELSSAGAPAAVATPPSSQQPSASAEGARTPAASAVGFPRLVARLALGRIVVIGALAGRDRGAAVPTELGEQIEWIDTERDGAHAIGNLPQRIRQGRVAAVVILDRAVQHRHTDPVMAAARDSGVPFAFAGQGGKASLARALEQLEAALAQSAT